MRDADEIRKHTLSEYAAIFIGGGNTYRLSQRLKNSGAFELIKEYLNNGRIVYGGSAGAIIFGKSIDSCLYMDTNDVVLGDTSGFDTLFGFSFTAHYTNQHASKHKVATNYLTQYSTKEPIVALPEKDSLYTDGNTIKIVGTKPWYVFNGGKNKCFEPGTEYTKNEFISAITETAVV